MFIVFIAHISALLYLTWQNSSVDYSCHLHFLSHTLVLLNIRHGVALFPPPMWFRDLRQAAD